ncbi:MAG: precorrin-6y C5,15-methyltransferase (decarboxylating) subunit CbiE [Cyanobacteria bacterium]|nr:precorrin-6y C5,15-methyltransferase (decarboxylating) subunit CbiE [Cyanobacteriota bacterium]
MTQIQVVGIGMEGAAGLSPALVDLVAAAPVLVGSDRHLAYFPEHGGDRWPLGNLEALAIRLQDRLKAGSPGPMVVLTSGDPLFFGLGRWLLTVCPADAITFHPHVSAIQLAFSRVKLPWQEATLLSAHGRSLDVLTQALQQGRSPIALLTDPTHTPGAIARLISDLALPLTYQLWVCENLGSEGERVQPWSLAAAQATTFAPLNVVILQGQAAPPLPERLPPFGIPDHLFLSFPDRPGLMTKREVRLLILGELAFQPGQVLWDIGAGTGSVSIEAERLCPGGQVYAIEQTAMGIELIRRNAERFGTTTVQAIPGKAPAVLAPLPDPNRIFIGGSSGALTAILDVCSNRLKSGGQMILAIATLENQAEITQWLSQHPPWHFQGYQVNLSRATAVGPLTRWSPLNPVTLIRLTPRSDLF